MAFFGIFGFNGKFDAAVFAVNGNDDGFNFVAFFSLVVNLQRGRLHPEAGSLYRQTGR